MREISTLEGKIAVVTGGDRRRWPRDRERAGALRGRVFVTGRSVPDSAFDDSRITAIRCHHREDEQVAAAFEQVTQEAGAIDSLVNNVEAATSG